MKIHHLSETIINQISAGEVIERPASVVKELVENAIDAGATRIEITTAGGGKNLIRVSDNGFGIDADELPLAISRHCTSKMNDDVHDIRALGFRGEALPSIGSVSKLKIISRTASSDNAYEIIVSAGHVQAPRPAASNCGTIVEVRDLFFVTPARLKFMKTDRAEASAITDIVKRIAMAFPHIRFSLSGTDRSLLEYSATTLDQEGQLQRIVQIMGKDFATNSIALNAERNGVTLKGFAGIPSFNRGNSLQQFFYINGRPVRDKMLMGAIRGAYADSIARDRHAICVLFIDLPPSDVDVNVHPAKADVRFRDPGHIRGLVIGGIREALGHSGIRPASTGTDAMLAAFRPAGNAPQSTATQLSFQKNAYHYRPEPIPPASHYVNKPLYEHSNGMHEHQATGRDDFLIPTGDARPASHEPTVDELSHPLGAARAQIHKNYIIAQTDDSLIIVDQHAAHERLVYEALKNALYSKPLAAQMLLIPEIVELPEDDIERLLGHSETLQKFGLVIESFGPGALAVRETPALLGEVDVQSLIKDLSDEVSEHETTDGLKAMLDYVAATMACHGSIRSGRLLRAEEMNALLRDMEATPGSGTCNHGRPTYIELKLNDIERLFGRR